VWIEVLLLAKLARGPMHGYELRKDIEASTGRALSNNSLYPTLRRFVEAGAVSRSAEEQRAKPPRHVYTITEVGREFLHDMLADLPDELAGDDWEFLARVGNFGWLREEERLAVLGARQRALTRERERLTALASGQADPWSRLVLDKACRELDSGLQWVAEIRARITDRTERGDR